MEQRIPIYKVEIGYRSPIWINSECNARNKLLPISILIRKWCDLAISVLLITNTCRSQ